jgi:hypothetical protein
MIILIKLMAAFVDTGGALTGLKLAGGFAGLIKPVQNEQLCLLQLGR